MSSKSQVKRVNSSTDWGNSIDQILLDFIWTLQKALAGIGSALVFLDQKCQLWYI